jgi:uncharacterized repeat protein (TIGR01451 family)
MRRLMVMVMATLVGGAALAEPDFSASRGEVTPASPVAGDVVRYTITVTNADTAANYARVKSVLPNAYFIAAEGDCAKAQGARETGELVWHEGPFAANATRRCRVTVLTRREAAGTLASLATEITVPPSYYHRVDMPAELQTELDPNALRLGPVAVTRAGVAVLALLGVFAIGVPFVIARARKRDASVRLSVSAWSAVMIAVGFLVYFAVLGYGDWRTYADYRETRCTVFGSALQVFEGRTRPSTPRPAASLKPVFAVRYAVDGVETYSSGYASPSAINFNSAAGTEAVFQRFATGSTHPCWYDPRDPKTVLLARGPGGAYLFALIPLPVLAIGLTLLRGGARRRG